MPRIKQTTPEIYIRTDNLPPIIPKRDNLGLLNNIVYPYKTDGSIDWLRLAIPGTLYVKPGKIKEQVEKQYGKPVAELNPLDLEDKYLVISLHGLRHLARLAGFNSLSFEVVSASPDYAAVNCSIEWLGNYFSQNRSIKTDGAATATLDSTNAMTKNYLVEVAANRAEARNIRAALLINIVSREELQSVDGQGVEDDSLSINTQNRIDPKKATENRIKEAGFDNWKSFNNALLTLGYNKYKDYEKLSAVPTEEMMTLMGYAVGLQNGTLKRFDDKKQ